MRTDTQVRERGILFSDRLVRAILDGRKSQTRRVVKRVGNDNCLPMGKGLRTHVLDAAERGLCPYGVPGDRLYVREAWHSIHDYREEWVQRQHLDPSLPSMIDYRATHEGAGLKWRPSIHMPKWASRIWLEVTGVRVERVQEITPEDVVAEGVTIPHSEGGALIRLTKDGDGNPSPVDYLDTPRPAMDWPAEDVIRAHFASLWDGTNAGRGGCSWADNPWVWVVEFKRVQP